MIRIRSTITDEGAKRARQLVRKFPGELRRVLEEYTRPKIERQLLPIVRRQPPRMNESFEFGSKRSARMYYWLARTKQIPALFIGGNWVYQRTGRLAEAWRVEVSARRTRNGAVALVNKAKDAPGRVYPPFVYGPLGLEQSGYTQQPGHEKWTLDTNELVKRMRRLLSIDVTRAWHRLFKVVR